MWLRPGFCHGRSVGGGVPPNPLDQFGGALQQRMERRAGKSGREGKRKREWEGKEEGSRQGCGKGVKIWEGKECKIRKGKDGNLPGL